MNSDMSGTKHIRIIHFPKNIVLILNKIISESVDFISRDEPDFP